MMAHLHELLSQDQEPFQLHNYIADKRFQLKKPPSHKFTASSSPFPNKLLKPLTKPSSSRPSLCFSSFQGSPDVRNSPFPTPTKNVGKNPTTAVVFHVPANTAAVLLEAASKIQNQKPKTKNVGFGFFGSILKKLKDKNINKTPEFGTNGAGLIENTDRVIDINRKSEEKSVRLFVEERIGNFETEFSFSCCNNNSGISSSGWSENMETSCSTSRSDFYNEEIDLGSSETQFCFSPLTPFRFALQRSPSAGCRTPEFLSPAATPSRCSTEVNDNEVTDDLQNVEHEEEDEKDQCSPVSVLDPPFEDDEQDGRDKEEEEDEVDYDLEGSYAFMQKAQLRLLEKLRRFERLAELEPIELEKRMLEGYEDDDYQEENDDCNDVDELGSSYTQKDMDEFVSETFSRSKPFRTEKIPGDMRRLILDLIQEEEKNGTDVSNEVMMSIVCKKLDSWKEVESNTIDMMVELDLKREIVGWTRYDEEVKNRANEIELAIFELLVEEISEELGSSFIAGV